MAAWAVPKSSSCGRVIFEIQQSIFEQVIIDINEPITGSIEGLGKSTCATE